MHLIGFTDGACVPNPGPAGIGYVLRRADTGETVAGVAQYIGEATNNVAEARAVLEAVKRAVELGATSLSLKSDSTLIVNQTMGTWSIKQEALGVWIRQIHQAIKGLEQFSISYIPREQNREADRLSKKALLPIDEQESMAEQTTIKLTVEVEMVVNAQTLERANQVATTTLKRALAIPSVSDLSFSNIRFPGLMV